MALAIAFAPPIFHHPPRSRHNFTDLYYCVLAQMFAKRAATVNDEEDAEFPFLQEAHSPQGQHNIEYDPAREPQSRVDLINS
jgi:hypothetical protein